MKKYKEILFKKYEDFELENDSIRKKLLQFEVVNILKELSKPDSDDLYIWGLTYYMSDDDKAYHLNLALDKFLEAYELDVKNFMACLYIAHCYHDKEEFKNALKYYELVDKLDLKEFRIWRYVKLIEQIGFCHYKLGNPVIGRKLFKEVLEWYRILPIEDRPIPTEMLQCLSESDEIVIEIKKIESYLD